MPKTLDYSYVASSEITSAFVFGSIWSIMNLVNCKTCVPVENFLVIIVLLFQKNYGGSRKEKLS